MTRIAVIAFDEEVPRDCPNCLLDLPVDRAGSFGIELCDQSAHVTVYVHESLQVAEPRGDTTDRVGRLRAM